jgi:hypothetical protein
MKKLLTFLLIGIVILGIIAVWQYQKNLYSKDVMRLDILTTEEVEAGQQVEYLVRYKNNGDIRLDDAVLVFEFPSFSIETEGPSESVEKGKLKREIELGDIYPGDERTFTFNARVFGAEGSAITAKSSISYNPKGLRVRYESDTTNTVIVKSVPLTFELDIPSRLEPEKEFTFNINYFSNIDYPLTDLVVKVEYPTDFEFTSSQPSPLADSEWTLGVLNKADGGRIRVNGILGGDVGDIHTFRASIGLFQDGEFLSLKQIAKGVGASLSPLLITYQVNGSPNYSASIDEYLYYEIRFKNIGESLQENLFLTVDLDKDVFDLTTVQPGVGQFQRTAGMILWDSTAVSSLRFLPTMEEGKVDFWVKTKKQISAREPIASVNVSLGKITEQIETKINSNLQLTQEGYYFEGPFTNYGGPDPIIGRSTSYTILWRVRNFNNDLDNLAVRAFLPHSVKMTGEKSPSDTNISFDNMSREVIWNIGEFKAGETKDIYFQVVLDPHSGQREEIVEIISEATAVALDEWTDNVIERQYRAITSDLPDDSQVEDGVVQ